MEKEVRELIKNEINPQLADHKGACQFKSLNGAVVTIKLVGGCQGCPGRQMTFLGAIRPFIIENCVGVEDVILED